MNESGLWDTVGEKLRPFGKLDRIENGIGGSEGMPDVHYLLRRRPGAPPTAGWLELKWEPEWPVKEATPVILKTLTLDQVRWQQEHHELGGHVWTLARIHRTYLLLTPEVLGEVFLRRLSRAQLLAAATVVDPHQFPVGRVIKCLTS